MNIIEKIYLLMQLNDIENPAQLAKKVNLPYTTVMAILNKEKEIDIRLSTLRKFCDYFNISLTLLTDDSIDLKELLNNNNNNMNELSKIKLASYSGLNIDGLDETDIKELEEIIKIKKKLKEKKEN